MLPDVSNMSAAYEHVVQNLLDTIVLAYHKWCALRLHDKFFFCFLVLVVIYIILFCVPVIRSEYVIFPYRKHSLSPSNLSRANIRVINFTYNNIIILLNCGEFVGSRNLVHPKKYNLSFNYS